MLLLLPLLSMTLASGTVRHNDTVIHHDTLTMRMPGLTITHDDIYMHKSSDRLKSVQYVTSFEALANSSVVHHMIVYGCQEVQNKSVWQGGKPCQKGGKILWAWALDAPQFTLPANVSTIIGTPEIQFVVMELHYKVAQDSDYYDKSGMRLHYTATPTRYSAGVYLLLAADDVVLPANSSHVDINLGCNYTSPDINVFAFRTHAHTHATRVSGYRSRNNSWVEVGSRDPQLPELFVKMPLIVTIEAGDKVFARCEYDTSNSATPIAIGMTHHDEMCNFYMMYYTEAEGAGNVTDSCSESFEFHVPGGWYSKLFPHTTLFYIFIALCSGLILGPLLYAFHNCMAAPKHQRPGDGFEKLFGGEEDDEDEDEILYKSYKGGFH